MSARLSPIVFGSKVPAAIATPEALSATPLLCTSVKIVASRGRTVNTGSVFLGDSVTNDAQLFPLIPGATLELTAPKDGLLDLSKIFVDAATLTDGVQFVAVTP